MHLKMVTTKRGLLVPKSYFEAPQSQIDEVTNGCGPEGWKEKIVPDTIYGLNVTSACLPHDWAYEFETTLDGKIFADHTLYDNLIVLINNKKTAWWWVTALRKRRAKTFLYMVSKFGDGPFNDKELRAV